MSLNSSHISRFLFWAGLCLLIVSIFPSIYFDLSFGYENGPVELVQDLVFLIGFLCSLAFASRSSRQERGVWIFASTMFFIAFWRELSWGAAIPPLFDESIDPNTVTSHTLWYRPVVTPAIVIVALVGIGSFIHSKSWQLARPFIRAKAFPLREISFIVIASLIGAAAEHKMGLSLSLDHDASRTMEEMAELCAYIFLLAACFRTKTGLERIVVSSTTRSL